MTVLLPNSLFCSVCKVDPAGFYVATLNGNLLSESEQAGSKLLGPVSFLFIAGCVRFCFTATFAV